jgi:hypothetical protein
MRRLIFLIFLLFTLFSLAGPALSAMATEPTKEQLQTQVSILLDRIKELKAERAQIDPQLQSAYIEAQTKQYQYIAKMMEINIRVLNAQRWASYAILFLVVIVVLSGISFAGIQLWKSISAAGVQPTTDLELSAAQVRITSNIVGVIVLTISLVFLYIFTTEVYPIHLVQAPIASR